VHSKLLKLSKARRQRAVANGRKLAGLVTSFEPKS
jgi:hypothetical protein